MIDWTTLRAHLRSAYKLEWDDTEGVRLIWDIEGTLQAQWIHPVRAMGMPHVMIMCPAVSEASLHPRDAIKHNHTLAVGALALGPKGYVMRAVLPLDSLTFAALDRALEMLAHEAARLRISVTRPKVSVAERAP